MENRRVVIFLLALASFLFFGQAEAYDVKTHEHLVDETVEFYNKNFPNNKLTREYRKYLIEGAQREDDYPRYLNHFFDPVNKKGLWIFDEDDSWPSSPDWAQASEYQTAFGYDPIIASVLSYVDGKEVERVFKTSDFTWNEGIRYWLNGDKEMAMVVLGHILHLIQDTSVPNHTRNDHHLFGSIYEEYALKYTLSAPDGKLEERLVGKKPEALSDLDGYFKNLADYSNKYFYSEDTIGSDDKYNLPQAAASSLETINGRNYVKAKDNSGNPYYLALARDLNFVLASFFGDYSIDDALVKESYWSLLSVKSVQYGAGVVDLFFKDIEKASKNPNFAKNNNQNSWLSNAYESTLAFFTGIGDYIADKSKNIFTSSVVDNFEKVDELEDNSGLNDDLKESGQSKKSPVASKTSKTTSKTQIDKSEVTALKSEIALLHKQILELEKTSSKENQKKDDVIVENNKETVMGTSTSKVSEDKIITKVNQCSFNSSGFNPTKTVLINEVAWMGSVVSASDEWIELKNVSSKEIDLSGWQLIDKAEDINVNLSELKNKKLDSGQFLLLERTDNNSASGAKADLIYKGTLANSNEGLRLYDDNCNLIDEVSAGSKWPAGDNESKKTMERNARDFGWHSSNDYGGTPRRENSSGTILSGGMGGDVVSANNSNANSSSASSVNTTSSTVIVYPNLLITEVQLASASSTRDEFVEIYNPTANNVSLTDWYIQKKTKESQDFSTFAPANLLDGKIIPANDFLVISHPSSTALLNFSDVLTDYGVANDNFLALKNPNGDISDAVGWGENQSCGSNCVLSPADGKSIMRKSSDQVFVDTGVDKNDFDISSCPSPGEFSGQCISEQKPEMPVNFNVVYSSSTQEIMFNWYKAVSGVATDRYLITDMSTSSVNLLPEIVLEIASSTNASFSTSTKINELNKNYVFSLKACLKNICSDASIKEIYVSSGSISSVESTSTVFLVQENQSTLSNYYPAIGFITALGTDLNGKASKLEVYVQGSTPGQWRMGICGNMGVQYDVWHQCIPNYWVQAFSNESVINPNEKTKLTFDFPEFTFSPGVNYGLFIGPPDHTSGAVYGSSGNGRVVMYGYDGYYLGYATYSPGIAEMYFMLK